MMIWRLSFFRRSAGRDSAAHWGCHCAWWGATYGIWKYGQPIPYSFSRPEYAQKTGFDCLVEIKQVERPETSPGHHLFDIHGTKNGRSPYTNGNNIISISLRSLPQLKDIIQVALTLIYHELFDATDSRWDKGDQARCHTGDSSWEVGKDLKQPARALFILFQQYIASWKFNQVIKPAL